MRNRFAVHGLVVAALCVALFAAGARAQNPEKFERVVPAKPQPAAPKPGAAPAGGDALVQALVRKAQAGEREDGFCSRVAWPARPADIDVLFAPLGPTGGVVPYRTISGEYCVVMRAGRETLVNSVARRSVTWSTCQVGGTCRHEHVEGFQCRDKETKKWKLC